jgi:DNA-directed RNA polymerase subunit RPC12/RpoP
MSEFKFNCPHCDQPLECDEAYSGREIQCPSCNVLMRIPPVPGKTADYQPESGRTWMTHVGAGPAHVPGKLSLERKPNPGPPRQP